jgi:hypothetical protein
MYDEVLFCIYMSVLLYKVYDTFELDHHFYMVDEIESPHTN